MQPPPAFGSEGLHMYTYTHVQPNHAERV